MDEIDKEYNKDNELSPKDIITSHAAFGYLAKAYGLTQVAISGLSLMQSHLQNSLLK